MNRQQLEDKVLQLVREYSDEAEHQDGQEYWDNFSDEKEAVADFVLYLNNGYLE